MFSLKNIFIICCFFAQIALAEPRTEIIMWHAMGGPFGKEINRLAKEFNSSQTTYTLKPIYKGSYLETLTAYTAAFRAGLAPDLVQVSEVSRETMLSPRGVIKPVGKILNEQKIVWQEANIWPAIRAYYSKDGVLQAFPLNVSFPVMYFNENVVHDLPNTWQDFEKLLVKLKQDKYACPYTTAYPSWIHIESFYALHNISNTSLQNLLLQHLARLKRWHEKHLFEYAGRTDEATSLFTSGKCVTLSYTSASYNSIVNNANFKVGVAEIPVNKGSVRHANVVGGAALWVRNGLSLHVERGIAQFFSMMLKPKTQEMWYARTGYLPIIANAVEGNNKILTMLKYEWDGVSSTSKINARAQNRIRSMNDELIESLLLGKLTVEEIGAKVLAARIYADARFIKNQGTS
ncbi:MAG: hypothetical protein A3F18_05400 [Legionellales bacterium RIFCSPHIGHO2_12_FULL_37_14]|nr:MAG: hypothetical protein A3F18_05400 [Legionellales bacterium RIFCSPHIGHO2_12_FULL_37_14]